MLTVKGQFARGYVLAHLVLCHALVAPSVVLLEARDLQHRVGVFHFDFAGERDAICPFPGDFWYRTLRKQRDITTGVLQFRTTHF